MDDSRSPATSREAERVFINERGNRIIVAVKSLSSGDVQLEIVGPVSHSNNLLTRQEATVLLSALQEVLQ